MFFHQFGSFFHILIIETVNDWRSHQVSSDDAIRIYAFRRRSQDNVAICHNTDETVTIPSVMVSLDDGNTIKAGLPASATVREAEQPPSPDRPCHDTGVILGDVNLAACAGGNGFSVWSLDAADGGSLTAPEFLYSQVIDGVGIGHSAAFTWDGEIVAIGHEPGGGGQANCQAGQDPDLHTIYFLESRSGELVGEWEMERKQGPTENCTVHNYNVVPLRSDRYVAVGGHYQAGTWVVDFTDPANPETVAFSDPDPIVPPNLGGAWSSYWYNGFVYESEIQTGLNVFRVSDQVMAGEIRLPSEGGPPVQVLETSRYIGSTGRFGSL